jgi:hypothetical protein
MNKNLLKISVAIIFLIMVLPSCSKKADSGPGSFSVAYANIQLSATNLVPVDPSINAHAYTILDVTSDNVLSYDIYCDTISSSDKPNSFSLYFGKSGQNGTLVQPPILINLNDSDEAVGHIKLPQAIIDSFTNSASMYMIISSPSHPSGLMRAQISTSSSAFNYDLKGNYLLPSFYKEYSSAICTVANYHKLICAVSLEEKNVVLNEQKSFINKY